MKVGFRCDLQGFDYLCYAIEQTILNPELLHNLCNQLYVKIGEQFKVENNTSVERSIRNSINETAEENMFFGLNKIFNAQLFNEDEKPTAGRLINLMTEYYNLGLYRDFLAPIYSTEE